MANIMVIEIVRPEEVVNPRMLEITIPDSSAIDFGADDFANRLFIYTGIIVRSMPFDAADELLKFRVVLDLSLLPLHRVFDDKPYHFITLPDPAKPKERILWAAPAASP